MNVDNIRLIADLIEAEAEHFDMSSWFKSSGRRSSIWITPVTSDLQTCGTTACIAGWCNALANEQIIAAGSLVRLSKAGDTKSAAEFLGLPYEFARSLFVVTADVWGTLYPHWFDEDGEDVDPDVESIDRATAPMAVQLLRMIADGEIGVSE